MMLASGWNGAEREQDKGLVRTIRRREREREKQKKKKEKEKGTAMTKWALVSAVVSVN